MLTCRRGTRIPADKARKDEVRLAEFIETLAKSTPERVKGVHHNLKHNKILHEHNVVHTPRLDDKDRLSIDRLSDSFPLLYQLPLIRTHWPSRVGRWT